MGSLFNKKTIKDIGIHGKRVLLRADYNVPVKDGRVIDDYRIKKSLPTVKYLLEQNCSVVILSHLGRPDGKPSPEFSLKPVAHRLGEMLGKSVDFADDCTGDVAKKARDELKNGGVLVLENVRFHPEEEKDDAGFAKQVVEASGAEIFVQDGFGVVHRAHATTHAIAKLLPSIAGLLLEAEVSTITKAMKEPERPLVAVIGGAKISDKIEILNHFINTADSVAVVGAMANNFLLAEGHKVGKSLVEHGAMTTTKDILRRARSAEKERKFNFLLPSDVVVSESIDGKKSARVVDLSGHFLSDVQSYPKTPALASHSVLADELILDIGPASANLIAGAIKASATVIWNGTCGVTETKGIAGAEAPFSHGTRTVVNAMIGDSTQHKNRPFTVVGGGDTAGYVEEQGLVNDFSHVSTGGGASLELMSGKNLPGVAVLLSR